MDGQPGECKSPSIWDEMDKLASEARAAVASVNADVRKLHAHVLGEDDKAKCEAAERREPEGFAERIRICLSEIMDISTQSSNKLRELR
jgi:hypothetical protein